MPDAFHAALAIELGCEWLTLDRGFEVCGWETRYGLRLTQPPLHAIATM